MHLSRHGRVSLLAVSLALGACGKDATGPAASVAGTYVLMAVDGETVPQNRALSVTSGFITLTGAGEATRHITYLHRQTGEQIEFHSRGTFALEGNGVRFSLHDDGAAVGTLWKPFAERTNDQLSLHYPSVGAPDIVEVYIRSR